VLSEAPDALATGTQAAAIFDGLIRQWHAAPPELDWDVVWSSFPGNRTSLIGQIHALGLINCFQWHLEDACRGNYASQAALADLKHEIDLSNQRRMAAMDSIDEEYSRRLQGRPQRAEAARPALITPGSLLDRLSILELKHYHAQQVDPANLGLGARTVPLLAEQIEDLCAGTDALVQDLLAGRLRLKIYPNIKLYAAK
jgi:hypothetical protein